MIFVAGKCEIDEALTVTGATAGDYIAVFAQRDNNSAIVFGGTITGLTEGHAGAGLGTAVGWKQLAAGDVDDTKTVTISAGTGRRLTYALFRLEDGETLDQVEMVSQREASTATPTLDMATAWTDGDALFTGFGRQTSNTTLTTPDADITSIREATGTGHRSHYTGYYVGTTDPGQIAPVYSAASAYYGGLVHLQVAEAAASYTVPAGAKSPDAIGQALAEGGTKSGEPLGRLHTLTGSKGEWASKRDEWVDSL
jgi:hypothetical protein